MSDLFAFIKCLPILLDMFRSIQKVVEDAQANATVQDHINQVKAAFDAKDASKLNAVFNK